MRRPSTSTNTSDRRAIFVPSRERDGLHLDHGRAGRMRGLGRNVHIHQQQARIDEMRADPLECLLRGERVGQQLERSGGDDRGGVTERQVQRHDVLPEERRCETSLRASRASQLAIIAGEEIGAMDVAALLQQRDQQSARSRHRLERRSRVPRQALGVPRGLGIGGARLVGVVEERAEAAVRGHCDSTWERDADIVPGLPGVAS